MTAVPSFSNADPVKTVPDAHEKARAAGQRKATEAEAALATAKIEPVVRKGRERDLLDGKAEYKLVPIHDIKPDPDQPRKTFRNIAALATNFKEIGLLQPITVRITNDGQLILMYGERRLKAAEVAGWTHIPAIIRYGVVDSSILAQQLVENHHRDAMDPIDEARGIRRYMADHKIATHLQAAQKLGVSQSWVSSRMALLSLGEEDQARVSSKEMTVMAGAAKARLETGNVRKSSVTGMVRQSPHFSDDHFLAGRARSRCAAALKAGNNHGSKIGGVACGACWEVVIRQDARRNSDVLAGSD